MASGKAMGPDELPAELLKLGLSDSSHGISRISWHHRGYVDDGGCTIGVETRHHQWST